MQSAVKLWIQDPQFESRPEASDDEHRDLRRRSGRRLRRLVPRRARSRGHSRRTPQRSRARRPASPAGSSPATGATASRRRRLRGRASICTRSWPAPSTRTTATGASTPCSSPGSDRGGVERLSAAWPRRSGWTGACTVHSAIGSTRTTATIHPERFTRALGRCRHARAVPGSCTAPWKESRSMQNGVVAGGAGGRHGDRRRRRRHRDGVRGRSSPHNGCRCRRWPGSRATAWCSRPGSPVPAQALFVEYERRVGRADHRRRSWSGPTARCGPAASPRTIRCPSIPPT